MSSRHHHGQTKRGSDRHPLLLPCHLVRERDGEVLSKVALDLSTGGMLALTGARVLTGEPVRVTLRAPVTGAWLSLEGTVARVVHGRRPGEWGRRLGIAFHGLTAKESARLQEATELLSE